jgi:2-O-methyltransferase
MIIFKTTHDVLAAAALYLPKNPVIVEGGAFIGHDTQRMALFWPQATLHAFEPVPQLCEELQKNMAPHTNVICYQQALSNRTGSAQLYIAEKPTRPGAPSQASSLLQPKERLHYSSQQFTQSIEVSAITLDDWAKNYRIERVDFLWLDLQGCELAVLQAAPQLLQHVRAIYTEVQFVESYEKNPLYQEIKVWLAGQGFVAIARDFDEKPRSFFGNILVVKK